MTLATAVKTALVDTEAAQEFAAGYQVGQVLGAKDRALLRVLRDAGSLPVIDLQRLMVAGGGTVKLPKLAVAHADDRTCRVSVGTGKVTWSSASFKLTAPVKDIAGIRAPRENMWGPTITHKATADVPLAPPEIRPDEPLAELVVAWEAQWRDVKTTKRYLDPILLKHLQGNLYAVLGTWNMTKVEQAALRMSRID